MYNTYRAKTGTVEQDNFVIEYETIGSYRAETLTEPAEHPELVLVEITENGKEYKYTEKEENFFLEIACAHQDQEEEQWRNDNW